MKTLNGWKKKVRLLGILEFKEQHISGFPGFHSISCTPLPYASYMSAGGPCRLEMPLGTDIKAPRKACFLYPEGQPSETGNLQIRTALRYLTW